MCSLGENILAVHKAKTADASRLINKSICDTMKLRELPKACDYQTSVETCWWMRLQLIQGNNVQDNEELKDLLKWIIRSEAPKP